MLYASIFMVSMSVGIISIIIVAREGLLLDVLLTIAVFAIAGMMLYKMIECLIK